MATIEIESEHFIIAWTIDADMPWVASLKRRHYGPLTLAMFASDTELLAWVSGHEDKGWLEAIASAAIARRGAWLAKARGEGVETIDAFTLDDDRPCLVVVEAATDEARTSWQEVFNISASRSDADARMSEGNAREILRDYSIRNPKVGGWLRLRSLGADGAELFASRPHYFHRDGEWAVQILEESAADAPGVECFGGRLSVGDQWLSAHDRADVHEMTEPGYAVLMWVGGGGESSRVELETADELREHVARWIADRAPRDGATQ